MAAREQIWTALACSEGASDRMRRWLTRQLAQLRVDLERRDEMPRIGDVSRTQVYSEGGRIADEILCAPAVC